MTVRVPHRLTPLRGLGLGTLDAVGTVPGVVSPTWTNRGTSEEIAYTAPIVLGVWDCEADRPHDDPKLAESIGAQPVQHGAPLLRVRIPWLSSVGPSSHVFGTLAAQLYVGGLDTIDPAVVFAQSSWSKGGASGVIPPPTNTELGIHAPTEQLGRLAVLRSCRPALNILPYAHRGNAVFNLRTLAGGSRYVAAYLRLVESGGLPFVGRCVLQHEVLGGVADEAEPWRDVWHGVSTVSDNIGGETAVPSDWGNGSSWSHGDSLFPLCPGTMRLGAVSCVSFRPGWVAAVSQIGGALAERAIIAVPAGSVEGLSAQLAAPSDVRIMGVGGVGSGPFKALVFASVTRGTS